MNFLQLLEEQLRQQRPAFQPTAVDSLLEPQPAATMSEYSPGTFTPNAEGLSLLSRVGLGFMPGAGVGDFLGQFPDAEGGLEPSALENWAAGNYGTTVLQSLGAVGDVAMLVPGLGLLGAIAKAPRVAQLGRTRFGDLQYDSRFDPRVKEQPRIQETTTVVEPTSNLDAPVVSLADFEGYPFITSMSDRTRAGGLLTTIDDVPLNRPVQLQGGQDWMFENPGMVWASGSTPVNQIMDNAQVLREVTGRDPLYIPWRMSPSGGDFATMTGETMLSYAESALPRATKRKMDSTIKKIAPDWKGIDSPDSITQYRALPDAKRKKIKKALDVEFREMGGLGIGQARLAVADPKQLTGFDGQIMNIGRVFADQPVVGVSGHPSYPRGVPGEGVGRVDRDINIFELLPNVAKQRGIPSAASPRRTDLRSLEMKPYAGILDEATLRILGY